MPSHPTIIPVLPSADIARDVSWYREMTGFEPLFYDSMYAVLKRDDLCVHLQWHAGTAEDPLGGGSVIRIDVAELSPIFEEFLRRGTVESSQLALNTPWRTNEFGFYDLNKNAIFIMEDLAKKDHSSIAPQP
jgi:hypothetical protein